MNTVIFNHGVIGSWDALVSLLDTEYTQLNKGSDWTQKKKLNVNANYKLQEKQANDVFHKEIEHLHLSQWRNDRVP